MLSLCLEVGDKVMHEKPKDYLQTIRYRLYSMFLHSAKVVQEKTRCPEGTATDSDEPNSDLITKSFQKSCLQVIALKKKKIPFDSCACGPSLSIRDEQR